MTFVISYDFVKPSLIVPIFPWTPDRQKSELLCIDWEERKFIQKIFPPGSVPSVCAGSGAKLSDKTAAENIRFVDYGIEIQERDK